MNQLAERRGLEMAILQFGGPTSTGIAGSLRP